MNHPQAMNHLYCIMKVYFLHHYLWNRNFPHQINVSALLVDVLASTTGQVQSIGLVADKAAAWEIGKLTKEGLLRLGAKAAITTWFNQMLPISSLFTSAVGREQLIFWWKKGFLPTEGFKLRRKGSFRRSSVQLHNIFTAGSKNRPQNVHI